MLAQLGLASALASLLLPVAPRVMRPLPAAGQLNLHNDRWDAVRVEVRVGPSAQCDQNLSGAIRTLRRGQVWAVVTGNVVCWRREANPGDGSGVWTGWVSQQPVEGITADVSL